MRRLCRETAGGIFWQRPAGRSPEALSSAGLKRHPRSREQPAQARTTRPSQRGYRGICCGDTRHGIQPASAAPHGAPAPDGVVVRPAAAGAHRRAHHRLVRVRPVCRPAPDAGGHRSLRRRGAVPALRLQQHRRSADPQCARSHRARRVRRLLDRLRGRRRRRLRADLHDGLSAGPGQPRRARRRQAAARRNPDHGRRPMLPAGHARGIQEAPAAALQLGVHASASPTASCSPSPATTTGTTGSTPSTACSARRATSSPTPRATSSAAGSASSTAATGRCACPTTGGSGAPTSSSRSISIPRRSTISRPWPSRWGPATTSSSAWPSRPG